ncbi:MAG: NUDIX domain-containing protein [Turicibacter sp.]|nr:NUDIX domain-containing protein [Turicibacter sp.]
MKETSCGAIIYRKRNAELEFLLIKSKGPSAFWGFPKGHMEPHETEIQTALREVFEETQLTVNLDPNFKVSENYRLPNGNSKEVIYFLGTALEDVVSIQTDELSDYEWRSYKAARSLLTFTEKKEILDMAYQILQTNKL